MRIYVQYMRNGGTVYSSHEGMNQDTVNALLLSLGATDITFITEQAYADALAAIALAKGY